jgi:SAM-dependent methyltransferase
MVACGATEEGGGMDQSESRSGRDSRYARLHQVEDVGVRYDRQEYGAGGHDEFLWSLVRPFLRRLVTEQRLARRPIRYLDFACGTGRIVSALEDLVDDSTGIDISEYMVEEARAKVRHTRLVVADVLEEPDAVGGPYDLVTAFRFFLNTDDFVRPRAMAWLARQLAGPHSRLVFNVHGNATGTLALTSLYMRLRGWGPARLLGYRQVRELAEAAGLRIEACYGFGLFPRRLHRGLLRRPVQAIERRAAASRLLRPISHDVLYVCRKAG